MENKYISNEEIKKIKKNIKTDSYWSFETDNYIEVLTKEVDFFVLNSDYFNKIKNRIEINYSENTINYELLFYGDIAYHNYHFLFDLQAVLCDYYNGNPDLCSEEADKAIEFIQEKWKKLADGFETYFREINYPKETKIPEPEPLDLSDSKTTDKIAYLYESGIIDFLHKKDGRPHTVNSIASLLSAITGIKANTIQSAINPFINTHSTSKSKPAESTLTKAKSKIIDLGF